MNARGKVTVLLADLNEGKKQAINDLFPLIYDELHKLASIKKYKERKGHTLNTTALVHEAYLKLVDNTQIQWHDKNHFFCIAAECMRRILIDYARKRNAAKRGSGKRKLPLDESLGIFEKRSEDLIALDDALNVLESFDQRQSEIVKLKYFVGFTIDEISQTMNISPATIKREWALAKSWLYREVQKSLN